MAGRLADVTSLPYAIAPVRFRFPALVALAGRSPLGGRREAVLAALQVARLVAGSSDSHFGPSARAERGNATRNWLAAIALPADVRESALAVVDATSDGDESRRDAALVQLADLLDPRLDDPSRSELRALIATAQPSVRGIGEKPVAVGVVTGTRRAQSGDTAASSAARPRAVG